MTAALDRAPERERWALRCFAGVLADLSGAASCSALPLFLGPKLCPLQFARHAVSVPKFLVKRLAKPYAARTASARFPLVPCKLNQPSYRKLQDPSCPLCRPAQSRPRKTSS